MPDDHEGVVEPVVSVIPSAPMVPRNVSSDDAKRAELQALVHVGSYFVFNILTWKEKLGYYTVMHV